MNENQKFLIDENEVKFALGQIGKLEELISSGQWDYSISKLRQEFVCYEWFSKHKTWTQKHQFLQLLFIFILIAFGLIPFIIYLINNAYSYRLYQKYEVHIQKLKSGRLTSTKLQNSNSCKSSIADEIKKLNDLKIAGVITPEEFEKEKQNILQ